MAVNDEKAVRAIEKRLTETDHSRAKALEKEQRKLNKRLAELDRLFSSLYEDKVMERITERNFEMMSGKYQKEQLEIVARLKEVTETLGDSYEKSQGVRDFLSLIRNYQGIKELDATIINALIDKILVSEREKLADGTVRQEIKIYYKFIGFVGELHITPTKRWTALKPKNCTVCGVEYVPRSGISKYCPACAKKIQREKSNESKRRSRERNRQACIELSAKNDRLMLIAEKQAEQKSLKMNPIFDKTLPAYLIGDVIHIKQILLNLINNAVKYTKEGQIDIKVSKNEEETKLIFEVKDTGIGIKEENLSVLFDAFMRVDSKKNKKIKGTGLGLAIAKQLAEQMDGMIWVESVYGKGSSFFVQLPMKKVSDGKISNVEWKETDERKRRSFVAPQAKILIVDDNPENLMVTRSLLKRTAVFVDTAASGEECVHKVRQNIYDLILLDYMMPQMDGIDTIRELKKDVQFHIPVIALTADVTKGIEQTFLREGFCAYLSKPVMWSKLEDLLMKYLRDDLVFIREDLKEEQKIKDEEFKQLKGQLKENDIKIEEGLRLLDGDFMQYRKLMEFFMEYQEEYMRQMQQLMTQKEVKVDEITRMMHTLKSNAKAIGAIHLYEIAKEMEDRGKQKDMEYIMSAYDLLKLEWGRVFKASREFIEQTKNILFDQKKEEEKDKQSKEEIKEKLKIFITRYQAKEAKEQIQYYRKGKISEEERNILKEMEIRIDQLDFDEAEILMKRWEGME
jgi:CheY-like chemotaxis protein